MPRITEEEAAAALEAACAARHSMLYQSEGFQQGDKAAGRVGIVAQFQKPKAALLRLKSGAWRVVANVRQIARSDPAEYAVYLTDASTQLSGRESLTVDEVVERVGRRDIQACDRVGQREELRDERFQALRHPWDVANQQRAAGDAVVPRPSLDES